MKSPLSYQAYQQLELISSEKSTNKPVSAKLNDIWQSFIAYLAGSSEPHVWKTQTGENLQWKVFDPRLQRQFTFDSEAEVRVWLEERHYQYGFASR